VVDQPLLWQQDGFALAQDYDESIQRYHGLWLREDNASPPAITDNALIVKPDRAVEQRAADLAARPPDGDGRTAEHPDMTAAPEPPPGGSPKPAKTRFFGTRELNPDRYAMDFKKFSDEVIAHLTGAPGVHLNVRIEIEATAPGGFDDARIRTVSENATQLKFDQSGFEEG
jgi:hypothetical protein